MKPRSREQSTKGETEIETPWGWEGKKKKKEKEKQWGRFEAKVDLKFRRCEGEKEKKNEIFTDSETVRRELELSDVRKVCVSEAMSLRWGVSEVECV